MRLHLGIPFQAEKPFQEPPVQPNVHRIRHQALPDIKKGILQVTHCRLVIREPQENVSPERIQLGGSDRQPIIQRFGGWQVCTRQELRIPP